MLVATTRDNVSPSLVLELLRRVGGIIKVLLPITATDTVLREQVGLTSCAILCPMHGR